MIVVTERDGIAIVTLAHGTRRLVVGQLAARGPGGQRAAGLVIREPGVLVGRTGRDGTRLDRISRGGGALRPAAREGSGTPAGTRPGAAATPGRRWGRYMTAVPEPLRATVGLAMANSATPPLVSVFGAV